MTPERLQYLNMQNDTIEQLQKSLHKEKTHLPLVTNADKNPTVHTEFGYGSIRVHPSLRQALSNLLETSIGRYEEELKELQEQFEKA